MRNIAGALLPRGTHCPSCAVTSICPLYYAVAGGGLTRGSALHCTHPNALQAPSAAHHALPISGQYSVEHVPLCRCVSSALCETPPRAPNRIPHPRPSRCVLGASGHLLGVRLFLGVFVATGGEGGKNYRAPPEAHQPLS
jgi:hypothetical protein